MKKNCWRYHHFTHVYQKPQSYVVQFLRMEWDRIFLSICAIFCPYNPLLPPNYPENQNVEKIKKASGDVIILNLCNKNKIIWCMLTQIWSATYIIFCHFRPIFALLPHCWPQKLKLWKNVKKYDDIILLHMCTINPDHMMYGSWDMKCNRQNFFAILGNFLPFYTPNSPKNENFKTIKKRPGDIII